MRGKLRFFIQQVREREGEHEQVMLRVTFSFLILLYLTIERFLDQQQIIPKKVYVFAEFWLLLSVGLLLIVLVNRISSRKRQ